jgi:hypothetical protein
MMEVTARQFSEKHSRGLSVCDFLEEVGIQVPPEKAGNSICR